MEGGRGGRREGGGREKEGGTREGGGREEEDDKETGRGNPSRTLKLTPSYPSTWADSRQSSAGSARTRAPAPASSAFTGASAIVFDTICQACLNVRVPTPSDASDCATGIF